MGSGRAGAASAAAAAKASKGTVVHLTNSQFAAEVMAAGHRVRYRDRFGDKAWIVDVHDEFTRTKAGKGMTLEAFKRRLHDVHFARLVNLSRADMGAAINFKKDRASEIKRSHFTKSGVEVTDYSFHFLRLK
jgi:hypothetical protein